MSLYKNPWDSGWRFWLIFSVVMALIAIIIGLKLWSKNELCTTYYSDMNRLACFMSDSTLPQRTNR